MTTGPSPNQPQDSQKRRWADLWPRVLSGIVLIGIALFALLQGGVVLAILIGGLFAGAYREWDIMVNVQSVGWRGWVLMVLLAISALVIPFGLSHSPWAAIAAWAVPILLAIAFALVAGERTRWWRIAGVLFFGLVILATLIVRGRGIDGIFAGLFVGFAVWATDTAAFFAGRQIGGAKLSPAISPSKTWSGALGGLAIGTISAAIVWVLVGASPWWLGVPMAAALSLVGQIGDLTESALKRRFKVKDSGDIIPGHGGLMDRLDSFTFVILAVYIIGVTHNGLGRAATGLLVW